MSLKYKVQYRHNVPGLYSNASPLISTRQRLKLQSKVLHLLVFLPTVLLNLQPDLTPCNRTIITGTVVRKLFKFLSQAHNACVFCRHLHQTHFAWSLWTQLRSVLPKKLLLFSTTLFRVCYGILAKNLITYTLTA